ncbi:MFS transporter [Paractinoplanes atraurantiacus]|uniref:Predicted arabinose efflux permease, MFS family n=1 Tax=Paractinoplanes atraurantiacus TaxID=1036182 RepID=A0A285JJN2_9ACTN|nr:MFS transporter [Actinoplanes atraurantiacus]SNY60509.1 Predicted arabinose efflux permease, MFS family [Actinoplanes atraurantiacus]
MTLTRYVGAAVCARLADEGARVAILLLALDRTGNEALGGLLIAALMVPHVVAAPITGALADAVHRRRLLYFLAFLGYGGSLLAGAELIGHSTAAAAALLILAGCCAPLLIGGLSSLLPDLVPGRLERAFGFDVMSYSIAGIAGPALAAVLADLAGASWSVVGLVTLVVAGAVLVASLPLPNVEGDRSRKRIQSPLAAFTVMVRRPRLGAVTLGTVFSMLGVGALPLVAALLAEETGRHELTGLVLSAGAAGGLLTSLLLTRWPIRRRPPEWVVAVSLAATAVPFLLLILFPAGWAGLPLFAIAGALGVPVSVAVFAVRDQESPPEIRTQVFTLGAGVKVTAAATGAAVAGLAAPAGVVALLAGIAVCQMLGALAVVLVPRVTPVSSRAESIVSQAN